MNKRILAILGFAVAALLPFCGNNVGANQSPATAYCFVPNPVEAGQLVGHAQADQDWQHAEQCGGQYGDLWTDGPLYSPSPSPSGLTFTIPANVWIVQGNRVAFPQYLAVAPANTISYWWLSNQTNAWTYTLSTAPPDGYSSLGYSITTNSSSITAASPAALAGMKLNGNLTLSNIASGNCLQTTTGGLIVGSGGVCGSSGGAYPTLVCSGLVTCNPSSGPTPAIFISAPLAKTLGGTGVTSPQPQILPTACGAAPSVANLWPNETYYVPAGCYTPIPLPLSTANGGTGTSAPSPMATATTCGQPVTLINGFPSGTIEVPICPTPYPTPTATASTGCKVTNSPVTVGCTGYQLVGSPVPSPIASVSPPATSTYIVMATNSITLGTSLGPQGKWYGQIWFDVDSYPLLSSGYAYGCLIATAGTLTTYTQTIYENNSSGVCNGSPTNAIAGTAGFGNSAAGITTGGAGHAMWTGTAANGTSITISCSAAITVTGSQLFGSCPMIWFPI